MRAVAVYSLDEYVSSFGSEILDFTIAHYSCPLNELMEYAMQKLQSARRFVGGKLVLVDREIDRPKLLKFYQQFNFKSWNVRHSKKDGIDYDQMLCVLNAPASGRAA